MRLISRTVVGIRSNPIVAEVFPLIHLHTLIWELAAAIRGTIRLSTTAVMKFIMETRPVIFMPDTIGGEQMYNQK